MPNSDSAELAAPFRCVSLMAEGWAYHALAQGAVDFVPCAGDVLVAEVDSGLLRSLEGRRGTLAGVQLGFARGDLYFEEDVASAPGGGGGRRRELRMRGAAQGTGAGAPAVGLAQGGTRKTFGTRDGRVAKTPMPPGRSAPRSGPSRRPLRRSLALATPTHHLSAPISPWAGGVRLQRTSADCAWRLLLRRPLSRASRRSSLAMGLRIGAG